MWPSVVICLRWKRHRMVRGRCAERNAALFYNCLFFGVVLRETKLYVSRFKARLCFRAVRALCSFPCVVNGKYCFSGKYCLTLFFLRLLLDQIFLWDCPLKHFLASASSPWGIPLELEGECMEMDQLYYPEWNLGTNICLRLRENWTQVIGV